MSINITYTDTAHSRVLLACSDHHGEPLRYCAMSLNYGPRIRYSDLSIQMFQRLLEAHPKLETTVELLRKGSKIIERIGSVQSRDSSDHDLKMEVNIGRVCLRAGAAKTPAHPDTTLDSLVRTHLFWCVLFSASRHVLALHPNMFLSNVYIQAETVPPDVISSFG